MLGLYKITRVVSHPINIHFFLIVATPYFPCHIYHKIWVSCHCLRGLWYDISVCKIPLSQETPPYCPNISTDEKQKVYNNTFLKKLQERTTSFHLVKPPRNNSGWEWVINPANNECVIDSISLLVQWLEYRVSKLVELLVLN